MRHYTPFRTGIGLWGIALVVGLLLMPGGQGAVAQDDGTSNSLAARVTALEEALAEAQQMIDALRTLTQHLSLVDLDDGSGNLQETLRISGVNLQVVNGTGSTGGEPNGSGNVIIGYNELPNDGSGNTRTGSHMLVVGRGHSYSRCCGIVSGNISHSLRTLEQRGYVTIERTTGGKATAVWSTAAGAAKTPPNEPK